MDTLYSKVWLVRCCSLLQVLQSLLDRAPAVPRNYILDQRK